MKKVIFATNIPAPYRVDMFNRMNGLINKNEISLRVYFFSANESDRNWIVDRSDLLFDHYISNCCYAFFARYNYHFHLNFDVIKQVYCDMKMPDSVLIVGGSWNYLTSALLLLMKKFRFIKAKTYFWGEANYMYSTTVNESLKDRIVRFLRKFVLSSVDGLIVPGSLATETFEKYWGINKRNIVFSNLVNQSKFVFNEKQVQKKHIVIPARLHENTKGILNFLKSANRELLKKFSITIAGDGPDRGAIEKYILENELDDVNLTGFVQEDEMLRLYAGANIFLLPSFRDPNPLTVIEALFCGLVLVISVRCGNCNEAVEYGENGFSFDPYSASEINEVLAKISNLSEDDMARMSKKSLEIADRVFDTDRNILRLLSEI